MCRRVSNNIFISEGIIFTDIDGSCGVGFSEAFVCLSVCLSAVPHDISTTAAARITKLDTEMFHHESWSGNPFISGSKGQRSWSRGSKNSTGVVVCILVIAGFF